MLVLYIYCAHVSGSLQARWSFWASPYVIFAGMLCGARRMPRSGGSLGSSWGRQRIPRTDARLPLRQSTRSAAQPSSARSTAAGACLGASRCAAMTMEQRRAARVWRKFGTAAAVRFNAHAVCAPAALDRVAS